MASGNKIEVRIISATDLKNVNYGGLLKAYAVVWVDPKNKCSTKVDEERNTSPYWDETLVITLPGPADGDTTLFIDMIHAGCEEDTKKLIGSAKLKLSDVINDVGLGERAFSLILEHPPGWSRGVVNFRVAVGNQHPDRYYPPSYVVPPPSGTGGYPQPLYGVFPATAPATVGYYPPSYEIPPPSGTGGGYSQPHYGLFPATAPATVGYYPPSYVVPPPSGTGGYPQIVSPATAPATEYLSGGALHRQPTPGVYGAAPAPAPHGGSYGRVKQRIKSMIYRIAEGVSVRIGSDMVGDMILGDAADKSEDDLGDYGGDGV